MVISVFYIVFYLLVIAFVLTIALAIYTLRIKNNKTVKYFRILFFVLAGWVLHKIIVLFISDVHTRVILHLANAMFFVLIAPLFFIVTIYHTNQLKWFKDSYIKYFFIIPVCMQILVFIPSLHHLIFYNYTVSFEHEIPVHTLKAGKAYAILLVYSFTLFLLSFGMLIRAIFTHDRFFRFQMFLFLMGLLIPYVFDTCYLMGISFIKNYNLGPASISICVILVSWSILGQKFFQLVPIARSVVVDNIDDFMIVFNNDGVLIDINKSCVIFFNKSPKDILGVYLNNFLSNYPTLLKALENKKNTTIEITKHSSNESLSFSLSFSEIEHVNTLNKATVLLMQDITESKKVEQELEESRQAFKSLFDQNTDGVFSLDMEGNFTRANDSLAKLAKLPINEILKTNFIPFIHPDDLNQVKTHFIHALNGEPQNFNTRAITNDREVLTINVINFPVLVNSKIVGVYGIVKDITEQVHKELAIQKHNEDLLELNTAKDKFLSIIGHDLRNPFNIILGYANQLRKNHTQFDSATIEQISKNLYDTSNNTYNLLENLLLWAQSQSNKIAFNPQEYKLSVLIIECINQLNHFALKKGITIEYKSEKEINIYADRNMLTTVIRNLIANAIKYSYKSTTIKIKTKIVNECAAEVIISDVGQGMSQLIQNKLFNISEVQTTLGTLDETGTGLGLILCKEFIEKNQGKIYVKSEERKGSDFIFTIPLYVESIIKYTEEFIEHVTPFKIKLANSRFYETGDILKVLYDYTCDRPECMQWKKEVEQAVLFSNKKRFEELIKL